MTSQRKPQKANRITLEQLGLLLEDVQRDVKVVAEGYAGLYSSVEGLHGQVGRNTERLTNVESCLVAVESRMGNMETGFRDLKSELHQANLTARVSVLEQKVATLEHS